MRWCLGGVAVVVADFGLLGVDRRHQLVSRTFCTRRALTPWPGWGSIAAVLYSPQEPNAFQTRRSIPPQSTPVDLVGLALILHPSRKSFEFLVPWDNEVPCLVSNFEELLIAPFPAFVMGQQLSVYRDVRAILGVLLLFFLFFFVIPFLYSPQEPDAFQTRRSIPPQGTPIELVGLALVIHPRAESFQFVAPRDLTVSCLVSKFDKLLIVSFPAAVVGQYLCVV